MEQPLDALRRLAARAESRRTETGVPRLAMAQGVIPEHELAAVYEPMINLILRGSKSMTIGGKTLRYDPSTYFVMSVDLPAIGTVHAEPTGEPYLAVSLTLDRAVIASLLEKTPLSAGEGDGYSVAATTPELLDAWVRLMRLMERPEDIPVLAPVYEREVLYRVLQGPQGWMLRDIATPGAALSGVHAAARWMREHFDQPASIDDLASLAAMSVSAFHRRFKAVTSMTPLQFHKTIRLIQARSLMVTEGLGAAAASDRVGYESPSQFNREYARLFGRSPRRDAEALIGQWRGSGGGER
jgi:AraC-like DNA-binding protein